MRRLGAIAMLLFAAVAGVSLTGAKEEGERTYRVDAVFYNAANLIPGQIVKIAGAEVGEVDEVVLTKDRRARVQMKIDERFAPFRANAKCRIRPQSLIGEKFIQCDPGSADTPALASRGDEAPTVPLGRNETPVDLDLVFASLRMPYRQRLALIVNELGTGLAGRPQDLNDAIRLANPALAETRKVLEIVNDDRDQLATLIDSSDKVIGELARRRGQVASFVDRAGVVAEETADHRGDLGTSIERLPPMLDELEPTATDLATLTREARPALADLRAASPGVRALAADLDPLNDAARPALIQLAAMSRTGRDAVRAATPIARLLAPVSAKLPPIVATTADMFDSMRKNGVVEGLQGFVYFAALATSRFDRYSHILPSYQVAGTCQQMATTPVAGCSGHFGGSTAQPRGRAAAVRGRRTAREGRRRKARDGGRQTATDGGRQSADGGRSGGSSTPPAPNTPQLPGAPAVPTPPAPAPPSTPADQLLDFLLGS